MPMDNMEAMFTHELEDMYSAEHEILDALDEMAEETEDESIAEVFREHRNETEGQIDRLEQVFDELGRSPNQEECEAIEGLIAEHEEIKQMDPNPKVLNVANTVSAEKTEHYEIAAYGNLTKLAQQMGMEEASDLLGQNLEEEKRMLGRLEDLSEEYDYESIA
jgi:ferritin-like metal-binding protein YciE